MSEVCGENAGQGSVRTAFDLRKFCVRQIEKKRRCTITQWNLAAHRFLFRLGPRYGRRARSINRLSFHLMTSSCDAAKMPWTRWHSWEKHVNCLALVENKMFSNAGKTFMVSKVSNKKLNAVALHSTKVKLRDDVIKWKHFPRYWPFVRGIHRSPVNFPRKGQWRGALMFSLICAWINGYREAGDLRRHRAHYDVIVMRFALLPHSHYLSAFSDMLSSTQAADIPTKHCPV